MSNFLPKIVDRAILWVARRNEVGLLDGIRLADMRDRGDAFCDTMLNSLRLVREHDPRRYARIKCFIHWIINAPTTLSARYDFSIRTCFIEFYDEIPGLTPRGLASLYATILIHESTHGLIESKGIEYEGDRRARIEHACTKEQNRFAARLVALDPAQYPKQDLLQDFDPSQWQEEWDKSRLLRGFSILSRSWKDVARTRLYKQRREDAPSHNAASASRRP